MALNYGANPASQSDSDQMALLYAFFNASPNWNVVAARTLNSGLDGFVVEKQAGGAPHLAFRRGGGGAGGLMNAGGAVAGSGIFAGVDSGGGITDLSSGSFAAGARWSGWVGPIFNTAGSTLRGRVKILDDVDHVVIRQRTVGSDAYEWISVVGKGAYPLSDKATGYVVMTGRNADGNVNNGWTTLADDVRVYEAFSGVWLNAYPIGDHNTGLVTPHDQNAGSFVRARWGLTGVKAGPASIVYAVGALKHLYIGPQDANGTVWLNGVDVAAVCCVDAVVVDDDGSVAE